MEDPGLGFDVLAASLRADARDLDVFLEVVALKFSGALPQAVLVEHEGGLLSKKRVKRVALQLGEHRYELARGRQGVEARRAHVVRGMTLKTEIVDVEQWIDELVQRLQAHAQGSEQARLALTRLLG